MSARSLFRNDRWTVWHAVAAAAVAVLGIVATLPAWQDIFTIARDQEESSHIFLVPIVVIWMFWARRSRFRYCKPTGTLLGPVIVAAGWLMLSYGFHHGIASFWQGGSVLVVLGCVVSVMGKHVIFRFFPAIAVLVFLVPVPGEFRMRIAQPLQSWTAQISQNLLEICGVPVTRSGNLLSINGQSVTIVEACNGMRMVFALILVSYAFSFGLPLRNKVRFLILLVSPLAAILCNLIRILPTVCLYGYAPRFLADAFHTYSGWMMLPIAFLMMLGVLRMLRWAMIPVMRYTLAA